MDVLGVGRQCYRAYWAVFLDVQQGSSLIVL